MVPLVPMTVMVGLFSPDEPAKEDCDDDLSPAPLFMLGLPFHLPFPFLGWEVLLFSEVLSFPFPLPFPFGDGGFGVFIPMEARASRNLGQFLT